MPLKGNNKKWLPERVLCSNYTYKEEPLKFQQAVLVRPKRDMGSLHMHNNSQEMKDGQDTI